MASAGPDPSCEALVPPYHCTHGPSSCCHPALWARGRLCGMWQRALGLVVSGVMASPQSLLPASWATLPDALRLCEASGRGNGEGRGNSPLPSLLRAPWRVPAFASPAKCSCPLFARLLTVSPCSKSSTNFHLPQPRGRAEPQHVRGNVSLGLALPWGSPGPSPPARRGGGRHQLYYKRASASVQPQPSCFLLCSGERRRRLLPGKLCADPLVQLHTPPAPPGTPAPPVSVPCPSCGSAPPPLQAVSPSPALLHP